MDDGLLDLALFEARPGVTGILDSARHLGRGVTQTLMPGGRPWSDARLERFEYRRGAAFELTTYAPLSIQVDGEFLVQAQPGERVSLASDPGAVRMLVSAASSPLYSD